MRRLLAASILLALLAVAGYSQTFRGAINGTVTDPSGAVVANAKVVATNIGTAVALNTVTTSDGQYSFQDLPLGTYKVTVSAGGFSQVTVDQIAVTAGSIYTLPVQLKMGQQTTAIEVSAAALTVDTTTTTQSNNISDQSLQNMPLNGRDWSQLIAVAPGYGGYSVNGFGSVNGTRANQVNWQIDGTDNNDFWHNIPAVNQGGVSGIAGVVFPIDAIDEFSAQSQSQAESGRNAGGVVNLVTKSGTNTLHGSAYYYNRNEFYAAHTPLFTPPPGKKGQPLRNQNYGFSIGGPIIKNKTFFFAAFEKQNYVLGLQGLSTQPSAAWQAQALDILNNPGNKYGVYPSSLYPTGSVPVSSLSQTLLNTLWPASALTGAAMPNNFAATAPSNGYSYNGTAKIDHNFNDNNHLSVRWFAGQGNQTQPPGFSAALASASSLLQFYFERAPIHVQNYSVVLNSVLSPKMTNQVLFGVSYFNQTFSDANNSFDMKALGLDLSPDATINGKPIHGASNIKISGFDQVGITPPEGRNDITGHLTDIISYTMGKHQFRFGGEVRQGRVDEFYFRHSLGSFAFDGSQGPWNDPTNCGTLTNPNPSAPAACSTLNTNNTALADYLGGLVRTASIAVGNAERKVLVNSFDFFGQDQWQVTRKLNLNLGLRYGYVSPLHNGTGDLTNFDPTKGLVQLGTNGLNSLFPRDFNNFAPRVGFAYQPRENGSLVVRGGFGVFYDQVNMNPFLDDRPPNPTGADGLQDNPAGKHPVSKYGIGPFTPSVPFIWPGPNPTVFPGVVTCPTGNGCGASSFNIFAVDPKFRTPYFYNYNLNVEHSLGRAAVLQIGYVGSEGRKLTALVDVNQPALSATGTGALPFGSKFPNFATINTLQSAASSNYNSLQTTLKLRSWRGLTSQVAYTWAHALDDMSAYRGVLPQNSFNLKGDYGNGDFDTRHNFTALLTYEVPGSSHGPKILTHGWQVSSFLVFHGGQPVTGIFTSTDTTGTNEGQQHPNLVGDPFAGISHSLITTVNADGSKTRTVQWLNPAAFALPAPGTFGDLRRNQFFAPGFADVDLSVFKNIPITERFKVQLRAEMFNIFNRLNLAAPSATIGSGFGVANDTLGDLNGAPGLGPGEPFNMQLAAKIIF